MQCSFFLEDFFHCPGAAMVILHSAHAVVAFFCRFKSNESILYLIGDDAKRAADFNECRLLRALAIASDATYKYSHTYKW